MRPMPRFGDQYPYDLNPDCSQLACDASSFFLKHRIAKGQAILNFYRS